MMGQFYNVAANRRRKGHSEIDVFIVGDKGWFDKHHYLAIKTRFS